MEPGWEPEWGPEWESEWEPTWYQTGTKLGPNGPDSLEGPWRSLCGPWGSLEVSVGDQTGAKLWSGTGPAPGTQKVPKVYHSSQKHSGHGFAGSGRYQILGPPGDSLKYPTRILICTKC